VSNCVCKLRRIFGIKLTGALYNAKSCNTGIYSTSLPTQADSQLFTGIAVMVPVCSNESVSVEVGSSTARLHISDALGRALFAILQFANNV
jgi:hypothetical protein